MPLVEELLIAHAACITAYDGSLLLYSERFLNLINQA